MTSRPTPKSLYWIASTREDLKAFPRPVQRAMGVALRDAQKGGKHGSATPLKGFKGAGVLEVVQDHDGDTYRAVYTVRFAESVYVCTSSRRNRSEGSRRRRA